MVNTRVSEYLSEGESYKLSEVHDLSHKLNACNCHLVLKGPYQELLGTVSQESASSLIKQLVDLFSLYCTLLYAY